MIIVRETILVTVDNKVQKRILNKSVKEPEFADFVSSIEVNLFDGNKTYSEVFAALKDYYREHGEPATKDILETYLYKKLDRMNVAEGDRIDYNLAIDDVYSVDSDKDEQVFDELITNYISKKRMMYALKVMALAYDSDNEKAFEKFDKAYTQIKKDAQSTGQHAVVNILDSTNGDDIADYIRNINKGLISIPVEPYQEATGGLSRGEVGLIAAASGGGKSQALVSIAAGYSLSGYNVLYVDLEELYGRKLMRFYRNMLGYFQECIPNMTDTYIQELATNDMAIKSFSSATRTFDKFKNKYQSTTGKPVGDLIFTRYSPHTLSVGGLRQLVENLTMVEGKKIDVIIVDYPDLLKYNIGTNESLSVGMLYEELRSVAQDYNAVMWTASQLGRRKDSNSDIRTGDDIQGSIQKKNAVEFVGVINVSHDEFDEGFGRIWVDKSRNGGNYASIINFKTDKLTGRVRSETDDEAREHNSILLNQSQSSGTKEGKALKSNDVSSINTNLKGTFG